MSDCADLIGTPYVYGETDCIWLTLTVLERLKIEAPALRREWYHQRPRQWGRDLVRWGKRIKDPTYDGDVLVAPAPVGFAVVWSHGILHICPARKAVHWSPLSGMNSLCCRMNGSSSKLSAFRSRSIAGLLMRSDTKG